MTCGECANVTAPGTGFPNHVYCLRFLLHMGKWEDASRCRDFIPKPQTNADRIRAMSDEELADWLADILNHCENKKPEELCRMSCPLYKCCNYQPSDNIEDWLKSPVEVDNG